MAPLAQFFKTSLVLGTMTVLAAAWAPEKALVQRSLVQSDEHPGLEHSSLFAPVPDLTNELDIHYLQHTKHKMLEQQQKRARLRLAWRRRQSDKKQRAMAQHASDDIRHANWRDLEASGHIFLEAQRNEMAAVEQRVKKRVREQRARRAGRNCAAGAGFFAIKCLEGVGNAGPSIDPSALPERAHEPSDQHHQIHEDAIASRKRLFKIRYPAATEANLPDKLPRSHPLAAQYRHHPGFRRYYDNV